MVEIKRIRNTIVKGLYEYLELIPIPVEDVQPKEPYPYITYNFINPYTPFGGQGNYSSGLVDSNDERFKHDYEESVELQPTTTISINSYSKDKLEAQEIALKVKDWFLHTGYPYLSKNDLVVVEVQSFADRTVEIADIEYEFRIGMDVVIRFADKITARWETIESIGFNVDVK